MQTTPFGNTSLDRYHRIEKIGTGTYGVVYKALDTLNNEFIALKKIVLDTDSEGIPSTAIREICILRELQNPYIVGLKDVVNVPSKLFLVFEYLDQDLKQYMDSIAKEAIINPAVIKVSSI